MSIPTVTPTSRPTPAPFRTPPHRIGPNDGVVSRAQLHRAGIGDDAIRRLARLGEITEIHDGVWCTAGTVLSIRRQLLAACLAIGGVVAASHRAALWLWGLCPDEPPVEVTTRPGPIRAPFGTLVHVAGDLGPSHVTVRRGVPVTTPERTLRDVASFIDDHTLAVATAKARYLGLIGRVTSVRSA